jgi:hypothetical protein
MARVPLIDSPCPLSQTERVRIDGHCGRCNKAVHVLDGLDDFQRRSLLAAAKGPLCVSYRVPTNRAPAIGVAMAVMFSAGAAMAGQDCDEAKPAFQSVESSPAASVSGPHEGLSERLDTIQSLGGVIRRPVDAVWKDQDDEATSERLDTIVMTGGVSSAEDAAWVDDSALPDLPIVLETENGQPVDAAVALSVVQKPR